VGFDYVRRDKIIGPLTVLAAVASTLSFPLITYLPVFAGDVLHSGAEGYSLLLTGFGVGAIAGALTTAARGNAAGRGRVMLLGFAGFAISTLFAMASRHELIAVCLLVGAGFGAVTAFSTLSSLVQEQTPNEVKGRVLSIFGLAFRGGMPLGSLLAGIFVRRFGVAPTIGVQAAALLILVAVLWAWTGRGDALTAVHPEA
jgi:predicted MFS family arabinose efflux permease